MKREKSSMMLNWYEGVARVIVVRLKSSSRGTKKAYTGSCTDS